MSKKTFIDSCVLIAAWRYGTITDLGQKALDILLDPERLFVSSYYVKLEVLPQAIRNKREAEIEFYNIFLGMLNIGLAATKCF